MKRIPESPKKSNKTSLSNTIGLFSLFVAILGISIAYLSWQYPIQPQKNIINSKGNSGVIYEAASLRVAGSNNKIYIEEGKQGISIDSLFVANSNGEHRYYLPYGQRLSIKLVGSNNLLYLGRKIAELVQVNDVGSNNRVITK